MRIDGSMPLAVARAYGLKLVRPPAPAAPAAESQLPAKSAPSQSAKVQQIVAGRVDMPVDFNSGLQGPSSPDVLPLYSRSADRIEAATAVQLGRQLDIKA